MNITRSRHRRRTALVDGLQAEDLRRLTSERHHLRLVDLRAGTGRAIVITGGATPFQRRIGGMSNAAHFFCALASG
jgi:hypothetical protein